MNRPTCDDVQLLAPEVALGIASGDERALVLEHTKTCGDCRRVMEELSATADAVLLLGPLHEPPSGFESRVLGRMESGLRPPARWRWLVAAALASVLATGAAAFWITSDDRKVAGYYRSALDVANGKYFEVMLLRAPSGDRQGHMFAYEGEPTWVFLIFDGLEPGGYEAELETDDGAVTSLGTFEIDAGDVTWGRDIPVGLRDLHSVRVMDAQGAIVVQARNP
jgi:hypothetical protein